MDNIHNFENLGTTNIKITRAITFKNKYSTHVLVNIKNNRKRKKKFSIEIIIYECLEISITRISK